MATSMNFKQGQALVVDPKDQDDPVAAGLSGMIVYLVKINHAGHALVNLSVKGRPVNLVLRLQDLREKRDEKK